MYATATESARILAGGQASVAQLQEGARTEAEKWANLNLTPESFEEHGKNMIAEGENRIQNFELALGSQALTGQGQVRGQQSGGLPPVPSNLIGKQLQYNRATGQFRDKSTSKVYDSNGMEVQ
jgi:hypothetical protein